MIETMQSPTSATTKNTSSALGHYLRGFQWTHMLHLTTSQPLSLPALRQEFAVKFISRISRPAQQRVTWFYAAEPHLSGHLHLHALIGGTQHVPVENVRNAWRLGFARVQVYDATRFGAMYATAWTDRYPDWWDFSKRLPPRLDGPRPLHAPSSPRTKEVADRRAE